MSEFACEQPGLGGLLYLTLHGDCPKLTSSTYNEGVAAQIELDGNLEDRAYRGCLAIRASTSGMKVTRRRPCGTTG